jgi:hypothetical protein
MKHSELRKFIREEIESAFDDYEEEDEAYQNLGAEVYESDNYIMRSHPRIVDKFYVVSKEENEFGGRIVKCIGSATKCMNYIKKNEQESKEDPMFMKKMFDKNINKKW